MRYCSSPELNEEVKRGGKAEGMKFIKGALQKRKMI